MDPVAEIKTLYYRATKATIQRDMARAIDLLKTLPSDDERERAAVYMDGLSQMRSDWSASARPKVGELEREHTGTASGRAGGAQGAGGAGATSSPNSRASAPRDAAPRGYSGPPKATRRPR